MYWVGTIQENRLQGAPLKEKKMRFKEKNAKGNQGNI